MPFTLENKGRIVTARFWARLILESLFPMQLYGILLSTCRNTIPPLFYNSAFVRVKNPEDPTLQFFFSPGKKSIQRSHQNSKAVSPLPRDIGEGLPFLSNSSPNNSLSYWSRMRPQFSKTKGQPMIHRVNTHKAVLWAEENPPP